jgi:methylated-DNA-[protein]-cysteine S-methyltransferase
LEVYHIFDASFGSCAIAWTSRGISRFQLPEADSDATEARMRNGGREPCNGAPPPHVAAAEEKLQRYFDGEETDFSDLALDLSGCSAFNKAIYDAARTVGWGATTTYGALAKSIGSPRAARAVGHAMARNPITIVIPCHRVLAAGGELHGFSAYGGLVTKERLLVLEGVRHGAQNMQPSLFPNEIVRA